MPARSQARILWLAGLVLTIGVTVGGALALGGAHPYVVLTVVPLGLAGSACLFTAFRVLEGYAPALPAPCYVLVALAVYSALQAVPLPLGLVETLSPTAGDIWSRALAPFQEDVDSAALSMDPGASLREAMKWTLYAASFFSATLVAKRYGQRAPALIVLGSAIVVAGATVGHALSHATRVFGVYEPALSGSPWHVGPFLNPNTLAGYLNLGAFTGLGLLFSRRHRRYVWPLAVGVSACVGVSVLTGSRGGLGGLAIGVVVFSVLFKFRRRRARSSSRPHWVRLAPAALIVASGAALLVLAPSQQWKQFAEQDYEKLKVVIWALPMMRDFLFFGVGRGAFASVFPAYAPPIGNKVYSYPENLAVQWLSEWGILVSVVALVALAWSFRPRFLAVREGSLGIGATTGVVVLLLQNFVDFGLERVASALALTWALAVIWKGSDPAEQEQERVDRVAPPLVVALGSVFWLAALAFARQDVMSARQELHAAVDAVDPKRADDLSKVRRELRAAMLHFPAEPYFPTLGAELSYRAHDRDVLRWVSRALERGMNYPNVHILAAKALARYGARNQALMELRIAAELDPAVAASVGRLAAPWVRNKDDFARVAPKGIAGAKMLVSLAAEFNRASRHELWVQALHAAVQRDQTYTPARMALVKQLAAGLDDEECRQRAACVHEALAQADTLIARAPDQAVALELKARMLRSLGREDEAAGLMARACSKLSGAQYRRCLLGRLRISKSQKQPSLKQVHSIVEELSGLPCTSSKECSGIFEALGDALQRAGDDAGALEQYGRAARELPSVPVLFKIADLAVESHQFQRAENALDRAERIAKGAERERVHKRREGLRKRMIEMISRGR